MTEQLRAGVAGAGVFGGYHANKYVEVDGAELTAIFDMEFERAEAGATDRGVTPYVDIDAFLDAVDIVTVATPASTHGDVAERALEAGKHVLVEKPISLTLPRADRLIRMATEKDLVLQVGHQERYVASAFGLLDRPAPKSLRSRRLNKFSGRAMDVSVVFDLMVHDLDLLAQFTPMEGVAITSIDAKKVHGDKTDYVAVELAFPSGLTASLSASRIEDAPCRDLLMTYAEGDVGLDFLNRLTRNTTSTPLAYDFNAEEKPAALVDPLRYGTQLFVNAVHGKTTPEVTGEDGRKALALALLIEQAAEAVE